MRASRAPNIHSPVFTHHFPLPALNFVPMSCQCARTQVQLCVAGAWHHCGRSSTTVATPFHTVLLWRRLRFNPTEPPRAAQQSGGVRARAAAKRHEIVCFPTGRGRWVCGRFNEVIVRCRRGLRLPLRIRDYCILIVPRRYFGKSLRELHKSYVVVVICIRSQSAS